MHEVILEHPTHEANGYFWYIERALRSLHADGAIELAFVTPESDGLPEDHRRYVRVCWIDEEPRIIDLRDSHRLPLKVMDHYPRAIVLKSNVPVDYWRGTTQVDFSTFRGMESSSLEREIINHTDRVRSIVFGRAMAAPFGVNLRHELKQEQTDELPFEVACLVGAGQTWQQTHNRLRLLELLRETFGARARLGFFRPERCDEYEKVPHFEARLAEFELSKKELEQVRSLRGYYGWLARAKCSVNVPGFCLSQPFRFVDGVLAGLPVVTTQVWTQAYQRFPAPSLPFCAFTGHGRWAWTLQPSLAPDSLRELRIMQELWYARWLTPDGVFAQLEEGIK